MTPTDSPRDALILGGNRIPFARSGGPYAGISNQDLLTAALEGLVARYSLQGEKLGEIAGVSAVDVDLNAGGVSTATVTSEGPLDPAAARAAVEEAGYTLVEG